MSGHSKWAQIKHAKAATDKKRGQLFSKLVRQIAIAVREGGVDPESNFKLRLLIEKAREAEMPKDNIDRAIEKASGEGLDSHIESVTYEGFGPDGTAFIIEAATDSRNRTTSEIRHILEKHGGSLGQPNSVAWNFELRGQILVEPGSLDPAEVELAAIDAGAEDVKVVPEGVEVSTTPIDIKTVKQAIEKLPVNVVGAEIIREAKNPVTLDQNQVQRAKSLYEALSENDDVISVFTNAQIQ